MTSPLPNYAAAFLGLTVILFAAFPAGAQSPRTTEQDQQQLRSQALRREWVIAYIQHGPGFPHSPSTAEEAHIDLAFQHVVRRDGIETTEAEAAFLYAVADSDDTDLIAACAAYWRLKEIADLEFGLILISEEAEHDDLPAGRRAFLQNAMRSIQDRIRRIQQTHENANSQAPPAEENPGQQ